MRYINFVCIFILKCPPVVHDREIKGPGMSSCVGAIGQVKDPVPLIEMSRTLCPSGRFPPSFIH